MIETGVLFDDIHSFRDLNLVLAPFVLPPATPKLNFIDVPGMDGSLDATEATGEVKYKDREFSFTFTVFPQDKLTFEERQTVVSNALNGKRCKITLDKDPDYYFIGRCFVSEHFADKRLRQIIISVHVGPYKLKQHETVASFDLSENEERTIILTNGKKRVVPIIEVDGEVLVSFGTYSHTYVDETVKGLNIYLKEGANVLTIKAPNEAGTIKFSYREGDL